VHNASCCALVTGAIVVVVGVVVVGVVDTVEFVGTVVVVVAAADSCVQSTVDDGIAPAPKSKMGTIAIADN
jgi:hypothetical protein